MANVESFRQPGGGASDDEQLNEIIETQARTITALLRNYDLLLKKFEGDTLKVSYSLGAQKHFTNNQVIPAGWWIPTTTGTWHRPDQTGGHQKIPLEQYDPMFSDGTAMAGGNITLLPIETKVAFEK